MKRISVIIFLLVAGLSISSCYYDKKELVYPLDTCDTSAVSYKNDIAPLYKTNCYSCHSSSAASASGGGFILDTYAGASLHATHAAEEVEAGTMPKGGVKLSSCNIALIRTWARNGAPNN